MSRQRVLVIGHTDVGRRVCGLLRERGVDTVHLDDPTDADIAAHVDGALTGVAVLLHDDIRALRYSLVVEHLHPGIRLFVAIFDRTVRSQLEVAVPNCVVMSPAAISVPSMVAAAIAPSHVAIRRRGAPTVRAWVSVTESSPYALHEFLPSAGIRLRGALGILRGQLRPYDQGSVVLLAGALGLALVTAIDTWVGSRHDGFLVALHDAVLSTATVQSPGVGDDPWRLLWASVAAALVMGLTAAFGAGIVHHLLEGRHVGIVGRRVAPRSGHVIIAGLGQVGLRLAQELRALGIAVVCIEQRQDAPALSKAKGLGIPVIIDDAASQGVLRRAGIKRALAVVAAGSDERDNIAIAIAARATAPAVDVVIRAGSDDAIAETQSLFHIGAAIDVNALTAAFVAQAVHGERPYLAVHADAAVVAIDEHGATLGRYAAESAHCACS